MTQSHPIISRTPITDAIYRETPKTVQRRKMQGCSAVEMEAAAFFAVARPGEVTLAEMLYAGDDVSGSEWDDRGWADKTSVRERRFCLAAEACLGL